MYRQLNTEKCIKRKCTKKLSPGFANKKLIFHSIFKSLFSEKKFLAKNKLLNVKGLWA